MLFDVSSKEHQIKKADRMYPPAFELYCIISISCCISCCIVVHRGTLPCTHMRTKWQKNMINLLKHAEKCTVMRTCVRRCTYSHGFESRMLHAWFGTRCLAGFFLMSIKNQKSIICINTGFINTYKRIACVFYYSFTTYDWALIWLNFNNYDRHFYWSAVSL